MKVKELIGKLQGFDGDLMVVTSGYEGGVTEATEVSEVRLLSDHNSPEYFGEWELVEPSWTDPDIEEGDIGGVYIMGKRH